MLKNIALRAVKAAVGAITVLVIALTMFGFMFAIHSVIDYFHLSLFTLIATPVAAWGAYHLGDAVFTGVKEISIKRKIHKEFRRGMMSNDR